MPIRNQKPNPYRSVGVSDTVDATSTFQGAMSALTNLVPDPSTEYLFVPRPAAEDKYDFGDFADPGFVSLEFVVGDLVYGMIATSLSPGDDQPFVYDLNAGAIVPLTGVTGSNVPSSPNTTGNWTPPTAALIGSKVMVTHPGFNGTSNVIGWFDISTPTAPVWNAGNTATNALPSVPVAVVNFFDRAYYALQNMLWYSDTLDPTTITNATNSLTLGDTTLVVAMCGLPLLTTSGGIVQSLYAFKNSTFFQVTGDLALNTLALQSTPYGVGTFAPLSLCSTPLGISFMSPQGLRFVSPNGTLTPVVGENGSGICVPFINTIVPSRVCAAYNADTIRMSVQNDAVDFSPIQEYWYNLDLEAWSGPHNFPASLISAWRETFLMTPWGINAKLFQSDAFPLLTSAYIENGVQLTFNWETPNLPETGTMNMNSVIETSIGLAFNRQQGSVTATAYDSQNDIMNQLVVPIPSGTSVWGSAIWGLFIWGAGLLDYQQVRIPWTVPLVFDQMKISITGNAIPGFQVGNLYNRYEPLGYMVYTQ